MSGLTTAARSVGQAGHGRIETGSSTLVKPAARIPCYC
ncbi:MAG: hypothetical protein JWM50_2681 [Microbacteriaceae bacterium]|jgi:hypothetical protein|nr:hypothetical protein [Microbacteriaceae bacterium]